MKKYVIVFIFLVSLPPQVKAQVVDESIHGIQIGFLGIWLHNESKITPN